MTCLLRDDLSLTPRTSAKKMTTFKIKSELHGIRHELFWIPAVSKDIADDGRI